MDQLFKPELVKIVDRFEDKTACLSYLVELLSDTGCLEYPDRFLAAVKGREEIMSTGIGRGVAIPHARDLTVSCLRIALCMCKQGLDFDAIDSQPVRLVFMLAVPQHSNQAYMRMLRSLSEYLRIEANRNLLLNLTNEEDLYNYAQEIEKIILHNSAV